MESVLILPIVLFLLSGPIFVKGQGPVYLFGRNVTLSCVAAMQSAGVITWSDTTEDIAVSIYTVSGPDVNEQDFGARDNDKYKNFDIDNNYPNNANLLIKSVEVNDAGVYICIINNQASPDPYTVSVEAMPISVTISCSRSSPTGKCPSTSSPTPDTFSCTCIALGAYPNSLQFDWSGGATGVLRPPMDNMERAGSFDYYTDAEIVPTENPGSVTCTLNGYNQTWEGVRDATYMFNPPVCELQTTCIKTGNVVSLTCNCTDASPAEGLVYSFYRDGVLLSSKDTNVYEADIEVDQEYIFECRGCNGLNYGSASNDSGLVMCQRSTTALPTTTITTVPLSTKEPTSTKATDATTNTMHTEDSTTESTTEELKPTPTNEPEPFPIWVIILIIVVVLAVVIAVIAVIMYKKGKCGSNSSSSSVTDVKVTATNSHTTNSEPAPAPVYGEIKKDRKKKSDKLDDNGAGPRGDPEIPAYGVVDKNRTKDPTPAPRSSMRDSKNPSNPKQDGPMEMQYADLDHGNKPPSDEVRKPKEEPTEYATVQSVIV